MLPNIHTGLLHLVGSISHNHSINNKRPPNRWSFIVGGTDVTTAEHKFVPTLPDFRDFSIFLKGIFSALIWPFPPLKMIVR